MDSQRWIERGYGLICSIVQEVRSRLLVRDEAWSPVDKLAFHNGTLSLTTGEFNPRHNPLDRITKVRPYKFEPLAQCPIWLQFLNQATGGDIQLIELLQAWFRYAILPKPKERKAEIEKSLDLFGSKGTGKGTVLEVLIQLVGSENVGPASPETFKSAVGLGQLVDKDLAVDADSFGFLEKVGDYNKVVSNELVEVKKLYRDRCTMRLGVAVVRAYNAFITVPDGAEGLDRRLTVVPFCQQPQTIDTELGVKLQSELSGIFTWAWSLSQIEMKRRILLAGSIKVVAGASIERFEANNPEFRFLSEVFPHGQEHVKAGDLYQSYKTWCQENKQQPKSQVKFRPAVEALGAKRSGSKINGCYYYVIPRMADFDVADHLGIVGRRFETVGDSCQDSSNPDCTRDRDSSRQLETKSFLADTNQLSQLLKQEISLEDSLSAQLSTTIPNQVAEGDTAVSKSLPTILHSTESIPNLSPEPASNLSKPLNSIEARANAQPQQLTTAKSEPIEGKQLLPNTDNRFEILNTVEPNTNQGSIEGARLIASLPAVEILAIERAAILIPTNSAQPTSLALASQQPTVSVESIQAAKASAFLETSTSATEENEWLTPESQQDIPALLQVCGETKDSKMLAQLRQIFPSDALREASRILPPDTRKQISELVLAQNVSERKASLTEQNLAPDEPLKVGDRVVWNNCPSHCESWNPFTVTSIDKDYARLDYVACPVPISDLERLE